MLPSDLLRLPRAERAFILASIEMRLESEKKAAQEAKAKAHAPRGRRRRR
ncbi:MAG TPA: hypothetical protein H9790_02905 [Candidatus Agathobaculum intestinipullorum]|nr:hypothetical protein [Candidatus Agathobaculum intestinipullorum]